MLYSLCRIQKRYRVAHKLTLFLYLFNSSPPMKHIWYKISLSWNKFSYFLMENRWSTSTFISIFKLCEDWSNWLNLVLSFSLSWGIVAIENVQQNNLPNKNRSFTKSIQLCAARLYETKKLTFSSFEWSGNHAVMSTCLV